MADDEAPRGDVSESEERYRELYRRTPAMMHSIDREGRIVNVSELWLSTMGYEEREVIGRRSVEFLTEASRVYAEEVVLPAFFKAGSCHDIPYQGVRKDGSLIDLRLSAIAERDEAGDVVRSLAVLVDVTEQNRAERARRESEQRYQELLNGVEGIAWEAASDTLRFSFVSRRAANILGHAPSCWGEEGFWLAHVHPDDRAAIEEAIEGAIRGGRRRVEYRMRSAEGGYVWLRDEIGPVPGSGPPLLLRGVMIDISDQKGAQARIEESERRYRQIFESAGVALWDIDFSRAYRFLAEIAPHGADALRETFAAHPEHLVEAVRRIGVEDVNAETLRLFGAAGKEDLLGGLMPTLTPESYAFIREQLVAHVAGRDRFSSETVVRTLDGRPRHVIVTSVIPPQDDNANRALVSTLDVTERKDLEMQLRHAQKMEAVGQLAGGIAHDFNNLLAVILGRSEILAKMVSDDEAQSHLALIRETVDQASQLTSRLLAFSRRQVLAPQVAELNAIVFDTVNMLRRLIGEPIEIDLRLADDLALVRVDPGQIGQVVVNLALNARDAMPDGGELVIETRNGVDECGNPAVVLTVSDSGHGMDPATRARIFEPFFTTKRSGRGTGLGLATVYGIVEQSGGSIRVESEPGQGASFRVFLPRAPSSRRPVAPEANAEAAGGDETVLLVEDEAAVRLVTAEILRESGYHVVAAANAKEALAQAELHEGPIHLLLSDVVMPGPSGPELAERLRALRSEIRCLFMSGYTPESTDLAGAPLLQKPFAAATLLSTVRRVLDGSS